MTALFQKRLALRLREIVVKIHLKLVLCWSHEERGRKLSFIPFKALFQHLYAPGSIASRVLCHCSMLPAGPGAGAVMALPALTSLFWLDACPCGSVQPRSETAFLTRIHKIPFLSEKERRVATHCM